MSHNETLVCPNCGFHATGNYCSQCGQETHLHKETFWGLVTHFIGHYFHYDSKFWQTMKALWFSPGKLTVAYWNKQRMRYISPVSLYIFISAVYFLLALSMPSKRTLVDFKENKTGKDTVAEAQTKTNSLTVATGSKFDQYVTSKFRKIEERHGDYNDFLNETITHNLPKIFFFMIPVMALILKLLFIRRKTTFFVDHAIFALHYHSFWFSLFLIENFPFSKGLQGTLYAISFFIAGYYMVRAIHNVYGAKWGRAILNTFVLGISYAILLGVIMLIYALLVVMSV